MGKYKIYCDLDGVLCNFDKKVKENINKNPEKLSPKTFWKSIEELGVEFWEKLEWLPQSIKLWDFLIENFDDIEILTGSPFGKAGKYAKEGKNKWVKRELGDYIVNHKRSKEKHHFVENEFSILIDDTKKNISNWNEAGGTGIHFLNVNDTIDKLNKIIKNEK